MYPWFVIHQSLKSTGPTKNSIESIYFTCIVLTVTYCNLLWGTCSPSLTLNLEYMHACGAKVIHRLPWDTRMFYPWLYGIHIWLCIKQANGFYLYTRYIMIWIQSSSFNYNLCNFPSFKLPHLNVDLRRTSLSCRGLLA